MKYSEMTAVDFVLMAFGIGTWAFTMYSVLRARRHLRPGALRLTRGNLEADGVPHYRRALWSGGVTIAVVLALIVQSMRKG